MRLLGKKLKILMTRPEDFCTAHLNDYVFHGLIKVGHEVTDWPMLWYMYSDNRIEKRSPFKSIQELYGLGFNYARTIDPNPSIDYNLQTLQQKVIDNYFDLVIIGTLTYEPKIKSDLEDLIFKHYCKSKIIILCDKMAPELTGEWDVSWLVNKGTFFKRELVDQHQGVYPISIGFPKEKILGFKNIKKEKIMAEIPIAQTGPADKIFNNEIEYYLEYAKSYFGKSWKKDGWNVTRVYEIIASGAIPYITDIKQCPKLTNTDLPKNELTEVVDLIDQHGVDWCLTDKGQIEYWRLQKKIFSHFIKHCTTEALAHYVLDTHNNATQFINS